MQSEDEAYRPAGEEENGRRNREEAERITTRAARSRFSEHEARPLAEDDSAEPPLLLVSGARLAVLVRCRSCGTRLVVGVSDGPSHARRAAATPAHDRGEREPAAAGQELHLEIDADGDLIGETVAAAERELSILALEQADQVKAHAAELLGLRGSTFHALLERLQLESDADEAIPAHAAAHRGGDNGGPERLSEVAALVAHVRLDDDPTAVRVPVDPARGPLPDVRRRLRAGIATEALRRAGGNIAAASRSCGVKYGTFYEMIRRLQIPVDRIRQASKG